MYHRILGQVMPILEVDLEPGESVMARARELAWISPGVEVVASRLGEDPAPAESSADSLAMTAYRAVGRQGVVAFAARLPGQILAVDLDQEGDYLVHGHGYICGSPGVWLTTAFEQPDAGLPGEAFVLRRLSGSGTAFVELYGEVVTRDLAEGGSIAVRPAHVGLMQGSVQVGVITLPGAEAYPHGKKGTRMISLAGPGRVWLQTMAIPYLGEAILRGWIDSSGDGGVTQS